MTLKPRGRSSRIRTIDNNTELSAPERLFTVVIICPMMIVKNVDQK